MSEEVGVDDGPESAPAVAVPSAEKSMDAAWPAEGLVAPGRPAEGSAGVDGAVVTAGALGGTGAGTFGTVVGGGGTGTVGTGAGAVGTGTVGTGTVGTGTVGTGTVGIGIGTVVRVTDGSVGAGARSARASAVKSPRPTHTNAAAAAFIS